MTNHLHTRLDVAIARRDGLEQKVAHIKGRLSAALEEKARVEQECVDRGVQPGKLDAAIKQLDARYETAVVAFEADIVAAEGKLAPFIQEKRP